jgi:glycosyltransferase involved in cell wall biosynthesis
MCRTAHKCEIAAVIASLVIITHNRRCELEAAIRSALCQSIPVEVLVIDDGSTDGTDDMVRSKFPSVRLVRMERSSGCLVQRNRGAHLAKGQYVFSIDDDAEFLSPLVIEQTLEDFGHPRIGAVAIPHVQPRETKHHRTRQSCDGHDTWVTDTFVGTAHAVKREIFLKLGGYREQLVHQGEERDFCLRMLDAGYVTRLGSADKIHHKQSPRRDLRRMDFYGPRNDILFAWQNVPAPHFAIHLLGTTWNGLHFAIRCGRAREHLRGILAGYAAILRRQHIRQPVSPSAYRLHRRLKTRGPYRLSEIEPELAVRGLDCSG